MSATGHNNGSSKAFLPPQPIRSISEALNLLEEAACHTMLRDALHVLQPEDHHAHNRATKEIERCLRLSRMAADEALDSLEAKA